MHASLSLGNRHRLPDRVRRWRKQLLDSGASAVTAAKAYRLLRTILATAADDGAIRRNPCRIKGGGGESSPSGWSSPLPRYSRSARPSRPGIARSCCWPPSPACAGASCARCARPTLTWKPGPSASNAPSPNWRTVRCLRATKTTAGRRTVGFPELIAPAVRWHLSCFRPAGRQGPHLHPPERRAATARELPAAYLAHRAGQSRAAPGHFHDLRHTGNNLTATAGANLRELMARMGHSSTRAAMIYLHSTDERQREIADALGELAAEQLSRGPRRARGSAAGSRTGTQRARRRKTAS